MWSGATVAFNSKKARGKRTESGQLISRSITLADSGQTWQTGFHFFIFFFSHSVPKVGNSSIGKYQLPTPNKPPRLLNINMEHTRLPHKAPEREDHTHGVTFQHHPSPFTGLLSSSSTCFSFSPPLLSFLQRT